MRRPNGVRAAKCSDRWIGLRSPVSCAKPTTSDEATVFTSRSVMPTERSSKNKVRKGGSADGFIRALDPARQTPASWILAAAGDRPASAAAGEPAYQEQNHRSDHRG